MNGTGSGDSGYRAIERGAVVYARVDGMLRRGLEAARRGMDGLLAEALSVDELRALGVRLYGTSLPVASAEQGLWWWEARWFQARLPPPPARLFVGGAGAGREAAALRALGYEVDALEPVPELYDSLARATAPALAVTASYEQLCDAFAGLGGPATPLLARGWSAAILGWGSLTHVLEGRDRERLLRALDGATAGPILASFWLKGEADGGAGSAGRAHAMGRRLGRTLARLRGAPGAGLPSAFGHQFEREEIEALAAAAGRRVLWEGASGAYPHATFVR